MLADRSFKHVGPRAARGCRLDLADPPSRGVRAPRPTRDADQGSEIMVQGSPRRHGGTAADCVLDQPCGRAGDDTEPIAPSAPSSTSRVRSSRRVVAVGCSPSGDQSELRPAGHRARDDGATREDDDIDRPMISQSTPDASVSNSSLTGTQRRLLHWIEVYQAAYSGRPSPCRFTPTCSEYGHEAITVHGSARGVWLTFRRLLRCRPLGPSGFDPVSPPEKGT